MLCIFRLVQTIIVFTVLLTSESAVLVYQKMNETYFIQFEYSVLGLFWIVYVCTLAIGWTYAFGEKAWTPEDMFHN